MIDQNDWNGGVDESSCKEDWEVINIGFISFQMDSYMQVSKHIFEFFCLESFFVVLDKLKATNN